jgi:formylglycine-generating enzyme required for sulfatase activity
MFASLIITLFLSCDHRHEGQPGSFPMASREATATAAEIAVHPLEPEMVRIPAGSFLMGSNDLGPAERPVRRVYLDEYSMGKFEVTNAQFKAFCDATGFPYPQARWTHHSHGSTTAYLVEKPNYPVVDVNWEDAAAYCRWLSQKTGKKYRLPTEAEWEKAARGGLEGKKYPWGDEAVDAGGRYRANVGSEADNDRRRKRDGFLYTAPVGSFPPNGYGLSDMAGNVWEWCADVYDEHYYTHSPDKSPRGPDSGEKRVLRGGSWWGGPSRLPCAARLWNYPSIRYASTGFRVALTP